MDNNKIINLPISPIKEKDKKANNKKEPFGDLSEIIKKNILSQAKKKTKIINQNIGKNI